MQVVKSVGSSPSGLGTYVSRKQNLEIQLLRASSDVSKECVQTRNLL